MGVHPDPDRGDVEARLLFLIQAPALVRRVYERRGRAPSFADLEAGALQVLIAVQLFPDSTVNDIAKRLALAQSTTSRAVGMLQDRGLLRATGRGGVAQPRPQRITRAGRALIGRFLEELDERVDATEIGGWPGGRCEVRRLD